MDTNDFFEDDESLADLREAWLTGDPGTTEGPNRLSAADAAVARRAAFDRGERLVTVVPPFVALFRESTIRAPDPDDHTTSVVVANGSIEGLIVSGNRVQGIKVGA